MQEITIPQLLFTYYDANKELVWVDHHFIKEGIRQQRKQYFNYKIPQNDSLKIINEDMSACFVNGLPNKNIANKVVPDRIKNHTKNELQKIKHSNYSFIKIEMNAYIGNPN